MYVCVQLGQLESELAGDRESLRSAESLSTDLMKEKALLEKTLETLRENSERQVHTHTFTCTHTCAHTHTQFDFGSLSQKADSHHLKWYLDVLKYLSIKS